MDGSIDGWMDRSIYGWMDKSMDGWMLISQGLLLLKGQMFHMKQKTIKRRNEGWNEKEK